MDGSDHDTQENGWKRKNRKEGTPGTGKQMEPSTSAGTRVSSKPDVWVGEGRKSCGEDERKHMKKELFGNMKARPDKRRVFGCQRWSLSDRRQ